MRIQIVSLLTSLLPLTARSATLPNNIVAVNSSELLRIAGGLVLVLALIVFLSWLLRRLNTAGLTRSQGFKVVASMSLGTREKIMLVMVGSRVLLLGVTGGSINTLCDFGEELPAAFLPNSKVPFRDYLKTALRKS